MRSNFKIFLVIVILLLTNSIYTQDKNCIKSNNISRIVSVGGSITEILYFLGSYDKIIGVDITSNYPKSAKNITSIGYIRNLSIEGLLSINPTIIIAEDDIGPDLLINQLREANIDLRIIPEEKNLKGIIKKIKCISYIIGKESLAEEKIKNELEPLLEKIAIKKNQKNIDDMKFMMILSMQGTSPIVAGSGTSGDYFIKMLGGKNIFGSVKGWKSVTAESILIYNPDYIILPHKEMHKNSNVKAIMNNPIFKKTNAGKNDGYIIDDGMSMLGFGPRTIFSVLNSLNQILE